MSVGAIITRSIDRAQLDANIGLFNPSVGDFIIHRFCADENTIESFASLLRDDDALTQLFLLRRGKLITEDCFRQVPGRLVSRFWRSPFESPDFATGLSLKVSLDESIREAFRVQLARLASVFFDLADATSFPENLSQYAIYAVNEKLIGPDDERWLKFVRSVIGCTGLDEDLARLSELVVLLDNALEVKLTQELKNHVVASWKDRLSDSINEGGVATEYYDTDSDVPEVRKAVREHVDSLLSDYSIRFSDEDISAIVADFDAMDHIISNQDSYEPDHDDERRNSSGGGGSGSDEHQIDDLFDRDR